jgi:hypothetical protein
MQTFTATRTPAAFKAGKPAASARRSAVVVRAARTEEFLQTLGKHAAVAAAALALTLVRAGSIDESSPISPVAGTYWDPDLPRSCTITHL